MRKNYTIFSFLLCLLTMNGMAQLSGIKSIPGDYATISAAITALNAAGVGTGGVTFNIAAGYTESLTARISLTATGTSANPIIFKKNGAGANPLITAYTGGTATPTSPVPDGMWSLEGSDWVTIDGIDLMENSANTTAALAMEYGYGMFKASVTDGAQNNTIINCKITLNRVNTASWTSGYVGSEGIAMHNTTAIAATTGLTPTAATGSNSFNKIYSNTIENCNAGIALVGYAATSTNYALGDTLNDIGGTSLATGNIVKNYGGGAAATTASSGIYTLNQRSVNCSYNNVNSNDGAGVNHINILRGIYLGNSTAASANCNFNTVSVKGGGTTSGVYGIDVETGASPGSILNVVNVNNNTIEDCAYSTATTGAFYGFELGNTSAFRYNINKNVVKNSTHANAVASSALWYGINFVGSIQNVYCDSNTVFNITKSGGGAFHGIYSGSSPVNEYVTNNKVYDLNYTNASTTTSTVIGIYQLTATGIKEYKNNLVYNLATASTNTSSILGGIRVNYGSTIDISGNTVYGLSGTGITVYGIGGSGTTSGAVYNVYRNKIYNLSTSNASGVVSGIIQAGQTFNISNNYIGNLTATAANNGQGLYGINATSGSTTTVDYNTIFLNGTSTGALFGTSAISVGSTNTLTLRNNIFVNTSTPNGATGFTCALRRSGTSVTSYQNASNNNLFFAGTPSANNLVYYDGTNSDQTVLAFKARVSPRESSSFTENPSFVSTTGADATYLHINTTTATQLESGGTPVVGITTDFDNDSRNATTPDVGADEFVGVPQDLSGPTISYTTLPNTICLTNRSFTASITDPNGVNTTIGTKPRLWYKKSTENNALPATNTSADNGWKWVEATNTSSPYSFTVDYGLLNSAVAINDSISYFVTAQDMNTTPNVGVNSGTFAANPATVALSGATFPIAGNVNGYKFIAQPTSIGIKINNPSICISSTVTLDTLGVASNVIGAEYQWQSSPAGGNTFTNILNATTIPFTTGQITSSTDFRLVVGCGGTPISVSPSSVVSTTVATPQIVSTTPATRCGVGTLNLMATANSGAVVNWYDSSMFTNTLATGSSFSTPFIPSTKTFYASASVNGSQILGARLAPASTSNVTASSYGLVFNATQAFTLATVQVYPAGSAGNVVINLTTSSGTVLQTTTVAIPSGTGVTPFTIPLNFSVPIGTDMRLIAVSSPAMVREASLGGFPYALGSYGSITNGYISGTSTAYYYFYNWKINEPTYCESARTPIVATVTAPPAITITGGGNLCIGNTAAINVTSPNSGYAYTWTPGPLTGAAQNVSPTTTTKYVVNATDNSGGANNGCINIDSVEIAVIPAPSTVTVTPTAATVCATAQMLTASGGVIASQVIIGIGTGTNSSTGFPAPLGNQNGGARHQILYYAADLTAQGMIAGAIIDSLTFYTTAINSATAMNNYIISLGNSTATSLLSTAFESNAGFTQVYSSAAYTPVVGSNTFVFSTPFVWNGTSNIIVETVFNNEAATVSGGNASVLFTSTTPTNTVISYRASSITGGNAGILAVTTPTAASPNRTNIKFGYRNNVVRSWAPTTGLFKDAAATIAYNGIDTAVVFALPTTTTTYTVSATLTNTCAKSAPAVITRDCSLPVTITNFSGEKKEGINQLVWNTSSEINNLGFELESSVDGSNFSKQIFIASKAVNGNSNLQIAYGFNDVTNYVTTMYYRLKQIDRDGKFSYSNVVKLAGIKVNKITISSVFPNPTISQINVLIASPKASKLTVTVVDVHGKVLQQHNTATVIGDNLLNLQVAKLASGVYYIKAIDQESGVVTTKQFVKQ